MDKFKKFRRMQIAEMRPVTKNDVHDFKDLGAIYANKILTVSISDSDKKNGSPKIGDMIARNPKDHSDQWLVAKNYFKDNFEPV